MGIRVRSSIFQAFQPRLSIERFGTGAYHLSSLADTDGLVELGEEVTQVEPGQTVGFLSYANLIA